MAIDPIVQRLTPKQRERWAWWCVMVLALLAALWAAWAYAPDLFHRLPPKNGMTHGE